MDKVGVTKRTVYAMALLTCLKVGLVSCLPLVHLYLPHDDRYFMRAADSIRGGEWLGPYTHMTLIKQPFYVLWVAGVSITGCPLHIAQHLLYAAACAAVVLALAPMVRRTSTILVMYAVLLFNPMTYAADVLRIIREGIYPAEVLLVFASLIGFQTWRTRSTRYAFAWATALGCSVGAFWLTREEGIWLVPSIALLLAYTLLAPLAAGETSRLRRCLFLLYSCAVCGALIEAVCLVNYCHYGIWATSELRWPNFLEASGALSRVEHKSWRRYVPVPREARERIYEASPAFRELQPFLEGSVGQEWEHWSEVGMPGVGQNEILGGWFGWALRDAVAAAGYHSEGSAAAEYYARLAREVNGACDAGTLEARARRSGMVAALPPWRSEYGPLLAEATLRGFLTLIRVEHKAPPMEWLEWFAAPYQALVSLATFLAMLGCGGAAVVAIATRQLPYRLVLLAALAVAILVRLLVVGMIDITCCPAVNPLYLSCAYPLVLFFACVGGEIFVLGLVAGVQRVRPRLRMLAGTSGAPTGAS